MIRTELVGRHSSILVDPFFARGLAICYDEISLPDQDLNQMQKPTRLPVRLFHARSQLRLSINKARDNPSSFVISMRPTKIRVLVARLSMQDS